jgi:hypothetical protein
MYEKLIEALREETRNLSDEGYASCEAGDLPSDRFVKSIERIASRLEGTGDSCETPKPSFYTASGTLNGQNVSVRVDCVTGEMEIICAEPDAESVSDDDEPLTAEWLREVMPHGRLANGTYWLRWDTEPSGCTLFITCRIQEDWTTSWQLNVTTRGEYRALRKMLGIPMGDA